MNRELTWNQKYELAKKYYEHNGNLKVPHNFKTVDGYTYDDNGVCLGEWIITQRQSYRKIGNRKISEERIKLLTEIGMRFEKIDKNKNWMEKYELAKKYYEHYGNLEIKSTFKTSDGYTYDEKGFPLGIWIANQRQGTKEERLFKISDEKKELLKEIGMRFEVANRDDTWNKKYELAKKYYEHYGNLKITQTFRTIDGYTYDENGIKLGVWIACQRDAYKGTGTNKINDEKIKLLNEIGMVWSYERNSWEDYYKLAEAYYNFYKNLDVPSEFRTVNGYVYDKDGAPLGEWISIQNSKYKNKELEEEKIELLNKIKMIWKSSEYKWNTNYDLARKYYKHYGNLDVPCSFKTNNGYKYDEKGSKLGMWVAKQRSFYRAGKLSDKRIEALEKLEIVWYLEKNEWEDIYKLAQAYYEHHNTLDMPSQFKTVNGYEYDDNGISLGGWISNQRTNYKTYAIAPNRIKLLDNLNITWFNPKVDYKLQHELITSTNITKKKKEITNRTYTLLNKFDGNDLPSKEELNKEFIKQLCIKK